MTKKENIIVKEKIIIVEDHQMFAEGLSLLINSTERFEIDVVVKARKELFAFLLHHSCRIILLDLNLQFEDGLQICHEIKQKYPNIKVIILTGYYSKEVINKARQVGADGFFTKDMASKLLIEWLERILHGAHGAFILIDSLTRSKSSPNYEDEFLLRYKLSSREKQIMDLMLNGKGPDVIAKQLFISYETIKTHRKHIFTKLGISNITELVKFAIRNNLISS